MKGNHIILIRLKNSGSLYQCEHGWVYLSVKPKEDEKVQMTMSLLQIMMISLIIVSCFKWRPAEALQSQFGVHLQTFSSDTRYTIPFEKR